jgi:hypothetical protein
MHIRKYTASPVFFLPHCHMRPSIGISIEYLFTILSPSVTGQIRYVNVPMLAFDHDSRRSWVIRMISSPSFGQFPGRFKLLPAPADRFGLR